jgi:hypothetical protein
MRTRKPKPGVRRPEERFPEGMNTCILCSKHEGKENVQAIICSNCVQELLPKTNDQLQSLANSLRLKDREEAAQWIEKFIDFEQEEENIHGKSGETRKLHSGRNPLQPTGSQKSTPRSPQDIKKPSLYPNR